MTSLTTTEVFVTFESFYLFKTREMISPSTTTQSSISRKMTILYICANENHLTTYCLSIIHRDEQHLWGDTIYLIGV